MVLTHNYLLKVSPKCQKKLNSIFVSITKDEFSIKPRYAQKNLNKSEKKKSYGWSNLIYETNFIIIKPRKTEFFQISML